MHLIAPYIFYLFVKVSTIKFVPPKDMVDTCESRFNTAYLKSLRQNLQTDTHFAYVTDYTLCMGAVMVHKKILMHRA